jgi:REP element-mobilizing transposase RayT
MEGRKFKNRFRVDSIRLKGYDYSQNGFYFITICTKYKRPYFGVIEYCKMRFTKLGCIAHNCWLEIPKHFPFVVLDAFVIMPDHVHGILVIKHDEHIGGDINGLKYIDKCVGAGAEAQRVVGCVDGVVSTSCMGKCVGAEAQNFAPLRQYVAPLHLHQMRYDRHQNRNYTNKFGPQSQNIASIIRGFKIGVTKYARQNNIPFLWQALFHDRIIRNEKMLFNIRRYIMDNPKNWQSDKNKLL